MRTDWRYEVLETPCEIGLEQIDTEKCLELFTKRLAPEQKILSTLIHNGPVAASVAFAAKQQGVDLLVIGTRGRGGLSKIALGSVAEELLRIAPCPVMTIGPKADPTLPVESSKQSILFATDFGKGSTKAFDLAFSLAQKKRAKLILLHMTPPMPVNSANLSAYAPATAASEDVVEWEASSRARCLQQLKACLPIGVTLEQEPEYVVGTELFPEGILTAADKFKVGLIVMGANQSGSPKVLAHIPWTVVHEVVRNAACPVLTVAGRKGTRREKRFPRRATSSRTTNVGHPTRTARSSRAQSGCESPASIP